MRVAPFFLGSCPEVGRRSRRALNPLDVASPPALIGARLDVAVTRHWYMRSHAQALWVRFCDIEGRIADLLLAAEYSGWDRFAVGAGVNSLHLFVEFRDWGGFNGRIESNFVGLLLYGKVLF
jgi:hypothetical protein